MPGETQSKKEKHQSLINTGPVSSQRRDLLGSHVSTHLCTMIGAGLCPELCCSGQEWMALEKL